MKSRAEGDRLAELSALGVAVWLDDQGLAKFEASWAELAATVVAELDRNHPGAE